MKRSLIESKDLLSAFNWESLRSQYFREKGFPEYADELQALADFYFQKISAPVAEEEQ